MAHFATLRPDALPQMFQLLRLKQHCCLQDWLAPSFRLDSSGCIHEIQSYKWAMVFSLLYFVTRGLPYTLQDPQKRGRVNSTVHASRAEKVTPASLGFPILSPPRREPLWTRLTLSLCSVPFGWSGITGNRTSNAHPGWSPLCPGCGGLLALCPWAQPHRIRHLHRHLRLHVANTDPLCLSSHLRHLCSLHQ